MGTVIVLKNRVQNYRLRSDAPFPSQLANAREMILAWRKEQKEQMQQDHRKAHHESY